MGAGLRAGLLLLLLAALGGRGHEKTLRKIVRNQSKMVQRAFSEGDGTLAGPALHQAHTIIDKKLTFSGIPQMRSLFHRLQRPKISTVLSAMEINSMRGGARGSEITKAHNLSERPTRNMYFFGNSTNIEQPVHQVSGNELQDYSKYKAKTADITEKVYGAPVSSKFFPPAEDRELQSVELKLSGKGNIIIPADRDASKENNSLIVKAIVIPNAPAESTDTYGPIAIPMDADAESEKADFLIEATRSVPDAVYTYNVSSGLFTCKAIKEAYADVDAQIKFSNFDIEPPWKSKKHYWNTIFDSRYESLMRNPKWPPLKVIVAARAHEEGAWEREPADARRVLGAALKKLHLYSNLTFSWGEVAHLSRWWARATHKSRAAFRKVLKSGRFEITTGGWVEPDEATTHLFGLVHQLFEGHQWLSHHVKYRPTTAWLTNSVSHSPTVAYLLSASDIHQLVFTNLHFSWEHFLAEYQYSDFVWVQKWDSDRSARASTLNDALKRIGNDRYPRHGVLAHFVQFAADGAAPPCGPDADVCAADFDFARGSRDMEINAYNIKDKAEKLLKQYSKTGTVSPHNVVLAPLGGRGSFQHPPEFDYQYNNYRRLAEFINLNKDIYKATVEFGTPKDYFRAIFENHRDYPSLKGDFGNFADLKSGSPAYWTGYYTTRPALKILLRRLESTLRTTELLVSFAVGVNAFQAYNTTAVFDMLTKARETAAGLLDRNVAGGTLTATAVKYVQDVILKTAKDCWRVQEVAASLMSARLGETEPYLHKYVYRDGEFMSEFKTVSPGDQIYVFNPSGHERTEVIDLVTRSASVRITDHNKKDVTVQINPVWKYNSEGFITISRKFFGVKVPVVLPPMTLELFRVRRTWGAGLAAASVYCSACALDADAPPDAFPFRVRRVRPGDVQLENYRNRLVFDELTGFLKTVIEKDTNTERTVSIDYGAFLESDVDAGMFLFNVNASDPLLDVLRAYRTGAEAKVTLIVSGLIVTQMTSVFGRLLQHTVSIFNLRHGPLSKAIYVESTVDYGPSPKNRDLELFLSIQTGIGNGDPLQIYTDNNCFQFTRRIVNVSRRIESNVYPVTCLAWIEDRASRLSVVAAHAQGVTALREGQLVALLRRRVLRDDARGAGEGLADGAVATHRHVLLLEALTGPTSHSDLALPSASALYVSRALDYPMDVFVVDEEHTKLAHYAFLPMIKTSFPCDVSVLNYRVGLASDVSRKRVPNDAFLTLHRHGVSCRVQEPAPLHCNGENSFAIDNILRNVKAAHQTNLPGTSDGPQTHHLDHDNFPPMELTTLRIHF